MKRILTFLFLIFILPYFAFSQMHLKTGLHGSFPIGFFIGAEYELAQDIGIEAAISSTFSNNGLDPNEFQITGSAIILSGRYYFFPEEGIDRLFIGAYLRPYHGVQQNFNILPNQLSRTSGLGVGFLIGKKYLRAENFMYEINIGIGRGYNRKVEVTPRSSPSLFGPINFDGFINVAIGYRL